MFLTTNELNEGAFNNKLVVRKKAAHSEGKNPKSSEAPTNEHVWHSSKNLTHVNSNWEKLRR